MRHARGPRAHSTESNSTESEPDTVTIPYTHKHRAHSLIQPKTTPCSSIQVHAILQTVRTLHCYNCLVSFSYEGLYIQYVYFKLNFFQLHSCGCRKSSLRRTTTVRHTSVSCSLRPIRDSDSPRSCRWAAASIGSTSGSLSGEGEGSATGDGPFWGRVTAGSGLFGCVAAGVGVTTPGN